MRGSGFCCVSIDKIASEIHNEYNTTEKDLEILFSYVDTPKSILSNSDQKDLTLHTSFHPDPDKL